MMFVVIVAKVAKMWPLHCRKMGIVFCPVEIARFRAIGGVAVWHIALDTVQLLLFLLVCGLGC